VTIANLPRLSNALDRIDRAYGQHRQGGVPLYLTEFGYQTNPPTPLGVSLRQQSAYLNESEFIAYTNPHVRTLSQFLLVDDRPKRHAPNRLAAYGGTFQTGLEFIGGRRKPSYASYRLPIYLPAPSVARHHTLRVWGLVRIAPNDSDQRVAVEFLGRRSRRGWRRIALVRADRARGYVETRVHVPRRGWVRLSWTNPAGSHQTFHSRAVGVRVR
jgi:hypothetical protein